jgi:RNA polymerase sigma-70 factor (sigma-E family)
MDVPGWQAPASFDDYVRARHAVLLRFAHVLCGDPHLAADLVQDALERTGMGWQRIISRDDPEGYVKRAIVNRYLNIWRRARRERVVSAPPDRAHEDTEPRDSDLWRLLSSLPRQQRAVLVLQYYEDMSQAAIAEVLGCSVGTVKSNGSRAMAKLREAMRDSAEATT